MTREEQIKQNAEEYASTKEMHSPRSQDVELDKLMIIEDYLEGAYSRDEEIAYLTYRLNDTAEKLQTVIAERDNLRNSWISVEERLPEEDKDNSGYSVKVIGMFASGHIADCFCSLEEDIWFIDIFTCDKPTHWMPIPKLK